MNYPESFKRKFKEIHPDTTWMHQALKDGDIIIGSFLQSESRLEIRPERIINAFKKKQERDILEEAKKAVASAKLYQRWLKIFNKNNRSIKHTI